MSETVLGMKSNFIFILMVKLDKCSLLSANTLFLCAPPLVVFIHSHISV